VTHGAAESDGEAFVKLRLVGRRNGHEGAMAPLLLEIFTVAAQGMIGAECSLRSGGIIVLFFIFSGMITGAAKPCNK
jgi:hypothetical protein